MAFPETSWLALCLLTETNQEHEMPYLAWVIRNRVERVRRWPNDYFGVITQKQQFSYFDKFQPIENSKKDFYRVANRWLAGSSENFHWEPSLLVDAACDVANSVIHEPRWMAPFGPEVDHYYSPCSMVPPGREPSWWHAMNRHIELPGVDPWRFRFAAER